MRASTSDSTIQAPIRFSEIRTADDRRFAVATLDAPATLNALSIEMVRRLTPKLREWAEDEQVIGVLLDAAGDKAYCAGGDLRDLYGSMRVAGAGRNAYAEAFFGEEYVLDHLIHQYPKPMLVWGHGIVMGGGVGLMSGASHRVVTERTRLAMPEVSIGLYPDVGGSWFLPRAPGRAGLFLALTAAPLNAADAIHAGLADLFVPHANKRRVLDAIAAAAWQGHAGADREQLTQLLRAAGEATRAETAMPASPLRTHAATIDALVAGDSLPDIAARLIAWKGDDVWLRAAIDAFSRGSPTSAALIFEILRRSPGLSIGDVFRLEYRASLGCCAHADFAEGIRALLIDKDRRPNWSPARLADVSAGQVEDHLRPRGEMPSALAALS